MEKLQREKLEKDEILEFISESELKFVEYSHCSKDLLPSYVVLEKLVSEIWQVLTELSQKTSLKFQKMRMLSESDQLDLVCAYLVGLP